MTDIEKKNLINQLFWDYFIDADSLLEELQTNEPVNHPNVQRLFVRAFESLKWQKLLDLFGKENILKIMAIDSIALKIRPQLRSKYNAIKGILRDKTLPNAGQDIERYRQAIAPFLSDRGYGFKSRIS